MSGRVIDKCRNEIKHMVHHVASRPPEAELRERGITRLINLSTNENPFPVPSVVSKAVLNALDFGLQHYPDAQCYELTHKLADTCALTPENFLVDNGLDGILTTIGLTFFAAGDEIISPSVTFTTYDYTARLLGCHSVQIPLDKEYNIDLEATLKAITEHTKAIFLCSPNNPTGQIISGENLTHFLDSVPEDVLVVIDEAFHEYVCDRKYPNTIEMLQKYENLVILRTFSKAWGIAGLRVGYAIASPEIIDLMYRARESYPVNAVAQNTAITLLDHPEILAENVRSNQIRREWFIPEARKLGFFVLNSHASFCFIDINQPAKLVKEALYQKGIFIRDLANYNCPNCIRVCIGQRPDLETFLKELKSMQSFKN